MTHEPRRKGGENPPWEGPPPPPPSMRLVPDEVPSSPSLAVLALPLGLLGCALILWVVLR